MGATINEDGPLPEQESLTGEEVREWLDPESVNYLPRLLSVVRRRTIHRLMGNLDWFRSLNEETRADYRRGFETVVSDLRAMSSTESEMDDVVRLIEIKGSL